MRFQIKMTERSLIKLREMKIKIEIELEEIKKEYNQKYNSVLGSKKDIYHGKQNIKIMSFQKKFKKLPKKM